MRIKSVLRTSTGDKTDLGRTESEIRIDIKELVDESVPSLATPSCS
jgi:hypothetical protein